MRKKPIVANVRVFATLNDKPVDFTAIAGVRKLAFDAYVKAGLGE